jgi:dephospho-CoA kinase
MLRVGLTGGIGSGKSTVAALFEVLGIPVGYADREAKEVMDHDPALREAITRHFGASAYAGGTLNRSWLASQVFPSPDKLGILNSLVHPATILAGQRWMEEQSGKAPYAVREAALIFESRSAASLDFIIGVYTPTPLRIHRAMLRDHSTKEQVLQRMRHQIDEDIKMRLCDVIIVNDDQQAIIPQVLNLHRRLLEMAGDSPSISA